MYIGIGLVIAYSSKYGDKTLRGEWSFDKAKDLNDFRQEIEKISPEDFLSAHITHKKTDVDKDVSTRQGLMDEIYKYMFYNPLR